MTINITIGLLDKVGELARHAGEKILKIYATDFAVDTKADSSPVTEADRIAEALIVKAIKNTITDEFPIVSEEAFSAASPPEVGGGPFWLVDPLDGTKEFVKRNGEFTVNIALIEAGMPVLGVVHAPVIKTTYWGSRYGSFAEDEDADKGKARQIQCRPPSPGGLVAMVSRSHSSPEVDDYLSQFNIKSETSAGSSLKFCKIAEGKADIYPRLGRTMEWDTAAGQAVLVFAGGQVVDLDGHELRYAKSGFENPHFVARGAEPAEKGEDKS